MIHFTKMPADQTIPGAGEWGMVTVLADPPREDVAIGCPVCGCHARLNHEIDAGGKVTPSLVCPHTPCKFHDHGVLDGWGHGSFVGGY